MQRSNTNTRAKYDPWLLSLETNGKERLFTWHWDKFQYRMKFILHSHGTIKNTDSAQDVLICLVSAPLIPDYVLYMVWKVWIHFQFTQCKNKRKKEKEFYVDWKLERSLSAMTCKEQISTLVSFTTLETKRNLGHINLTSETNSWIARPQRWFHLAQFPFLISKWPM